MVNNKGGNIYCIYYDALPVYVGQTIKPIEERWKEHLQVAKSNKGFKIHQLMREKGFQHFHIELLDSVLENLDAAESFWIKNKNTHVTQGGCNLTWADKVVHIH